MAFPWLRILNAVLGLSDMARAVQRRPDAADSEQLTIPGAGGSLEAGLAGVVVAALKEAFNRDHARLEFEREHLEAERQRAERALALELARQAGDRELGRLRFLAGIAIVTWLGTLFLAVRLATATTAVRAAFGVGWLLLLAAVAASFVAQSDIARAMTRVNDRVAAADSVSSGPAGMLAPWLVVAGLAIVGFAALMG
jgi:hypothetical protein